MNPLRALALSPLDSGELRAVRAPLVELIGSQDVIEDVYPLSPVQEAMLYHALASGAEDLYIVQQRLEIVGRLDHELFQRAWDISMERHPALRSMFVWERVRRPAQVVCRGVSVDVELVDLTDSLAQDVSIDERVVAERNHRFAFDHPPLMRLVLFKLSADRHELLWTQHHLVQDGWSATNVLEEVFASYEALAAGRKPDLAPARPYREYIEWLENEQDLESEAFWTQHLTGFDQPTRVTRDAENGQRSYVRISRTLDMELSDAVRDFARINHLTLNSVLVGALAIVLGRYTKRSDVAFGVVAAGRLSTLKDVELMVGMFINTLIFRVPIDEDRSVVAWLAELLLRQAEMMEHEHSPLPDVQQWSEINNGVPLTDTLFAYWNFGGEDDSPDNTLRYRTIGGYGRTSFPFSITVEGSNPLRIGLDFDVAEFDQAAADRFLRHYEKMLASIVADPTLPIGSLGMLTDHEHVDLDLFNDTATPLTHPDVLEAFRTQVASRPDDMAVTGAGRGLSYAELDRESDAVAAAVAPRALGGRVGIYMQRSPQLLVAILGVLKAGSTYVPVDRSYPAERVRFILADSETTLVLSDVDSVRNLDDAPCETVVLPLEGSTSAAPFVFVDPATPAYVMYTSGSTGRPKGVAVSHGNLINYVSWACDAYGGGEPISMPLYSSIGFDLTVTSLFVPLVVGGTVVVYPESDSGDLVVDNVFDDDAVDVVKLTPSHLAALDQASFATERIRSLIVGGEELKSTLARSVVDASSGRIEVFNEYGPTEATVGCMIHRFDPETDTSSGVAIGVPAANARVHLVDHLDRPVPIGVAGEICVAGDGVAVGYVGQPGMTAERFVAEPGTGDRMYRTGDLARWRGVGVMEFLGRNDDQVKVRGHRIELAEIESALATQPAIATAAVAVREPRPGDVRLVAYYVPADGPSPSLTELRAHLRSTLPDYMVVQNFVRLDALPVNVHGKLDRAALPAGIGETSSSTVYVAPETPAENLVVSMVSDLLDVEHVSVTDNFFELGGHSLLSLRLIAQLHAATGERISPRVVLLNTLQQVAAMLPYDGEPRAADIEVASEAPQLDRADSVNASAYFFGPEEAPLFGIHSSPSGDAPSGGAVLVCPPIGWEYMRTHWALRKMARLISMSGVHVLRFDYFGTGDSAGSSRNINVARWLDDISAAAEELREAAGTSSIAVVGVRLGATMAALAAAQGLAMDHLVLWDPVVSGRDYLATLDGMQSQMLRTRRRPYQRTDLGDELLGSPYPPLLRTELASIDLRALEGLNTRGTLIASAAKREYESVVGVSGNRLQYEVVHDVGAWDDIASTHAALLPTTIPQRIAKLVGGAG